MSRRNELATLKKLIAEADLILATNSTPAGKPDGTMPGTRPR